MIFFLYFYALMKLYIWTVKLVVDQLLFFLFFYVGSEGIFVKGVRSEILVNFILKLIQNREIAVWKLKILFKSNDNLCLRGGWS